MNYLIIHSSPEVQRQAVYDALGERFTAPVVAKIFQDSSPDLWELSPTKEKALGIEEVKNLLTRLRFRPLQLPAVVGVIWQAERLTVPAQNALLKDLEDKSEVWEFVLVADQLEAILPTIRSRCQVLVPTGHGEQPAVELGELARQLLRHFQERQDRVGAFQVIQQAADKLALAEISAVLLRLVAAHQPAANDNYRQSATNLQLVQEAYQGLRHNANKRLTLEDLWLRLQ